MKIGPLVLSSNVLQAPLAGYSTLAMRRLAREQGAAMAFTEVTLDQAVLNSKKFRKRILDIAPDDHPIGAQIMGHSPDEMAQAAATLVEGGYDGIDLNLACPVKKVLHRHRGGYLLTQPEVALAIVRAVRRAVGDRTPLTIKLRRAFDDEPADEANVLAILDGAFETGIDAATIHPRTVMQRYRGRSDWDFLARAKRRTGDRILLGSGDLFSPDDVVRMIRQTGVDGVTLARGAIGNPWMFRDCLAVLSGRPLPPPPTVPEQGDVIRRHLTWCRQEFGDARGSRFMRKFGIKYAESHPFRKEVKQAVLDVGTPAAWEAFLQTWYDPDRDWPPGRRRNDPGHLVAAGAKLGPNPTPSVRDA